MITEWIVYLISGFSFFMLSVSSEYKFPPPISGAQERELFQKLRTEGDTQARTKLIEHNLRLVAHIVRKYYTAQTGQEDLISIGTIGLIKAIDTFNDRNGARFATYAAKCIQKAMHSGGTHCAPVSPDGENIPLRRISRGVFPVLCSRIRRM